MRLQKCFNWNSKCEIPWIDLVRSLFNQNSYDNVSPPLSDARVGRPRSTLVVLDYHPVSGVRIMMEKTMSQFFGFKTLFGTDSDFIEPAIVTDGKVAISDVKLRI